MSVGSIWDSIQQRVRRGAKAPSAAQLAEASRQEQAASRREEEDEALRATSRRVMREMWPPRDGSAGPKA